MQRPDPRLFIRTTGHDGPVRHAVIPKLGDYKYIMHQAARALYPGRPSNSFDSFSLRLGHAPFGEKMAWMDLDEKNWITVRDDSPLLLYDTRSKDLGTVSLDYISPILPITSVSRPEVQDGAGDNPVSVVIERPAVKAERPIRVTYRYTRSYGGIDVETSSAAGLLPDTYQEAVQYAKESFAKELRGPIRLAVSLRDGTVVNVLPKSFIEYLRETLRTEPGSYICVNDPSSK